MSVIQIGDYVGNKNKLLGGCNSKVFEVKHQQSGKLAVAKMIDFSAHNGKNMYTREVEFLQKLNNCKHVIPLLHHVQTKDSGTLLLPRMKSDLLDALLSQPNRRFPEDVARDLFKQIISAVKECHDHGIAHLDLKPENIFLSSSNQIYLGDFGSSYDTEKYGKYATGQAGTAIYAAPELRSSSSFEPLLADIWSLGILFFVLSTGNWPYSKKDIAILESGQPLRTDLNFKRLLEKSNLSVGLQEVILSLLQQNPRHRVRLDELLAQPWFSDEKMDDLALERDHSSVDKEVPHYQPPEMNYQPQHQEKPSSTVPNESSVSFSESSQTGSPSVPRKHARFSCYLKKLTRRFASNKNRSGSKVM